MEYLITTTEEFALEHLDDFKNAKVVFRNNRVLRKLGKKFVKNLPSFAKTLAIKSF